MASLDADILALAGDSSSSDEAEQVKSGLGPTTTPKSVAPPTAKVDQPKPKSPKTAEEPQSPGATRSPAPKKRSLTPAADDGQAAKRIKLVKDGEELPHSSASSLRSATMSESSSASPVEGTFLALPEKEREEALTERATAAERDNQSRLLKRLLKDKDSKEAEVASPEKKRKAAAAELDANTRKSTRQKTLLGGKKVGEVDASLEEYKRLREEKGARDEQRKRDGEEKGKGPMDEERRHSNGSASSVEKGRQRQHHQEPGSKAKAAAKPAPKPSASKPKGEVEPPTLREIDGVRIGRTDFGQLCFYPGFEEATIGCFVRASFAAARGQNVYKLARIQRYVDGRPYAVEDRRGSRFVTTQHAVVHDGKGETTIPFIFFSDSRVTEAEIAAYKQQSVESLGSFPTKAYLVGKRLGVRQLENRRWTDAEITEKLRRSGYTARQNERYFRETINAKRRVAVEKGDEAAVAQYDEELAALDGPKLAYGTKLAVARPPSPPPKKAVARPSEQRSLQIMEEHRVERELKAALAANYEKEVRLHAARQAEERKKAGLVDGQAGAESKAEPTAAIVSAVRRIVKTVTITSGKKVDVDQDGNAIWVEGLSTDDLIEASDFPGIDMSLVENL
ncbi:MAG: hypothetical protein M1826_000938 [Phylliscum demangeonii]|nr:MAG: hypothetical protein M1826_000938 [Phylliscum demangeonii]